MTTEQETAPIPGTWDCFAFIPGQSKSTRVERDDVPQLLEEGARLWLNIMSPSREDTDWLSKVFGFHELALTDVLSNNVRPKQESYDDVLFTVVNAINLNEGEDQLDTINLNIFLTEQCIVSTRCKPLKIVRQLLKIMERKHDPLSRGTDYVYYMLLDGVVNRYLDVIDEVDQNLADLERDVFETTNKDIQERIFLEKRRLAYLKRSITPKRDALREIVHHQFPQIREEVRILLRDVLDHVMRIVDAVESYRELSNGLMDSHMTNISNRMNEVMKLMSIIATVMLPLSFLTGIFGMNFEVIPGIHFEYGFWVLAGCMTLLVLLLVWYFKRSGIL